MIETDVETNMKMNIETGFISFPTKWSTSSEEEAKQADLLGIEYKAVISDGFIDINPRLITSKNTTDKEDETCIRTTDGYAWMITANIHQVNQAIRKFNSLKRRLK